MVSVTKPSLHLSVQDGDSHSDGRRHNCCFLQGLFSARGASPPIVIGAINRDDWGSLDACISGVLHKATEHNDFQIPLHLAEVKYADVYNASSILSVVGVKPPDAESASCCDTAKGVQRRLPHHIERHPTVMSWKVSECLGCFGPILSYVMEGYTAEFISAIWSAST